MGTGETVKTVGGTIGGLASMVPGYGTAIGAGISGITSLVGGLLEQGEANKQKEQAANERRQANQLKPNLLQPEYWQKIHSTKMASLSHMPGYNQYIDQLAKNSANQMRSIRESSPNGAATLAAISATHGLENEATNNLSIADSTYKAGVEKELRGDLWNLGGEKDKQQAIADQKKGLMYQQANSLETAATANKNSGWNQILGGISSSATALTKNLGDQQNNTAFNNWYNDYISNQPLGSVTPMGQSSVTSSNPGLGMEFSANPY